MKSITIQWGQENEQRVGRHEERRSNHGCGQPARTRKKERKIGKMKKGIAMLLTLALLLTVLPAALAEDNAPDLKGTTIRILSEDCFSSDASWANILPLYAKVEADTGVKLDWEIITSDYTNIMLTRLAGSADGSPDIVQLNTDAGTWAKLIEDGVLVNIKELMDENAPHLAQFFREKRPDIMGSMTYVDGGIYTIPEISFVGKTEEQLTDEDVPYEVGVAYYREIARGLPPEAVRIATERLAVINAAWERIAAERGIA